MPKKTTRAVRMIGVVCAMGASLTIGRAQRVTFPEGGALSAQQDPGGHSNLSPWWDPNVASNALTAIFPREFRTIDGTYNNLDHPEWGSAGVEFLRLSRPDFGDGTNSPAGRNRFSARVISNVCVAQGGSLPMEEGASDFLWQWGQFIDHDLDMAPTLSPPEPFDIPVPAGDPQFDPTGTGFQTIPLDRSFYRFVNGVRQQVNVNTAYIDASMVYGSDEARARELRTLDGTGRLKTSAGDLLPFNVNGFPNAPSPDPSFFLAGDNRVNEQVGLTTLQTLFVREHNSWADRFRRAMPGSEDEQIYQWARAVVGAEIQSITYHEFLPLLLGNGALGPYKGYHRGVNAGVANEFATAAYRVGHTLLSDQLLRLDRRRNVIPAGNLPLASAFFNPTEVMQVGLDPVLRGLAAQVCQQVDPFIVDGVRNFLFGAPGAGGFDLASLNIQRGRDHGLASYNQVRRDYGLPPAARFADISPDPEVQVNLAKVYATPEDVDVWMGGLAEKHVPGALVGPLFHAILKDQFERARDGDRFWYQAYLPAPIVLLVERQSLAEVIRRNTDIGRELQSDAFVAPQ
jgi:peroxidase